MSDPTDPTDVPTNTAPEQAPVTASGAPVGEPSQGRAGARKVREGIVTSSAMDKTVVVTVTEKVRHPKYRKTVLRSAKLHTHDGLNEARVGDRVRVMETRPLSKTKRWRLVEILERAR